MAITYDLEHRLAGGGGETLIVGYVSPPATITGLTAVTNYEWRIRQVDTGTNGAVIYSYWSAWDAFTTAVANVTINVTLSNVAETGSVGTIITGDITPPVISLIGGSLHRHILGDVYTDPGYTATDSNDGDITGSVTFTDNINVNVSGKYQRTYDCIDAAGNLADSVSRDIHVAVAETPLSYNLNYREVGQATTSITGLNGSPYSAVGLTLGTNYEFQVQAVGTNQNSAWSPWFAFLTTGTVIPINVVLGNVAETGTVSAVGITRTSGIDFTFTPVAETNVAEELSLVTDGLLVFNSVTETSTVETLNLGTTISFSLDTVASTEVVDPLVLSFSGGVEVLTATAWDVELQNLTTNVVTSFPLLTQKTYEALTLTTGQGYSFRVRGKANGNTVTGEWSEWFVFSTTAVPAVLTPVFAQGLTLDVLSVVITTVDYTDGILTLSGTSTDETLVLFTVAGESFYKRVYSPTWSFTKTLPNTDLLAIDTLDELDEYDGASYYLLEGSDQVTGVDGILF